jgi:class 3 adenylate cyclase
VICARCGTENPDGAKFCNECAAPLAEAAAPAALEERKVVTILFCDLVGFTAASEQQDPEDVRARVRPYHARVRQEIERYGATVEKFVGDAVMAVYGAPTAHEDDAERAVRAGLAILEAIADLNEADPELDLQVRVGINTGEAVVALGASVDRGEGIVTGDVVNTASRIQSAAPVNGIAVSEQTYRATTNVFDYELLPPAAVKGKTEPLPLWRAKSARSRYGGDVRREFKTPFVGRELEKPLLIATFERAMQQRSPQIVTVVGEPGVGKTRLIGELLTYVHARPEIVRWRQGRCLPYGEGITFWALGEIVKAEAGILESDSPDVAAEKLETTISPDEPERQWLLQRLAPLVGAEATSPAERQELFTAWRRFLEALAATRPSILVFEDVHWADDALLAFLEYLTEWSQDVPLLVLCAARPELYERRPAWGAGQRNAQTINLSPLSDSETAELVSYLTKRVVLSPELEHAVLERAGGNPLYAEEFARLLADRGGEAVDEGELPDSVQALIAARLDTLAAERKSLLQDAAVVGKIFWAGTLVEIGGHNEPELELALHELARKELVRPARVSSMEGESEYSFWHLLVRDVAYSQIPRGQRARRHRAAAAWIERKAGDRVEDLAEVLAYHYLQALELAEAAGETTQAAELAAPARRFLALAGERALGLDTAQAEARLGRALELTPPNDPHRPQLLVRWAEAAFQAGRPRDATVSLEEALSSLRARGDNQKTAEALQLLSKAALRLGEGRQIALAAEAVELLEQEEPTPALIAAYTQLAHVQQRAGVAAEAIAAADRARNAAQQLGLAEPARALGIRGEARAYLGNADGLAEMERALALMMESGAGWDRAALQNNRAIAAYPLQGPAQSLAAFEEGVRFSEQRGLHELTNGIESNCPFLLMELGRTDEAVERATKVADALETRGLLHFLIEPRAVKVAVTVARGQRIDTTEVAWLEETARNVGAADVVVLALATAAAALYSAGDRVHARSLLSEVDKSPGARETPYYARCLPAMVRTALAADDRRTAEQLVDSFPPHYPLDDNAIRSARAQLREHADELVEAVTLYADAAARWRQFGNVVEYAYALLGHGRCLRAVEQVGAEKSLREAAKLFGSMGYTPVVADTDALLKQAEARAASPAST